MKDISDLFDLVIKVQIIIPIERDEEDIPLDFPLRNNNIWKATVNLSSKKIENWHLGHSGHLAVKVVDRGTYNLLDSNNKVLLEMQGYVPNNLIPGQWGDYIDLYINEEGIITNWNKWYNFYDFKELAENYA